MARRLIYEVLMKTADGNSSLGFFTDDFLATQAVNHLYDLLRQSVLRDEPSVSTITAQVNTVGWEQWLPANKNGSDSVFFYRPVALYNAVPSGITNFTFVDEGDTGVNPF